MAASGVRARLGRAFLLQAAFIGAAAVVGVFLASLLLEGVLIRQALREEVAHFWEQRERDPAFPLPATLNLTGYLGTAPPSIAGLPPGHHERVIDGVETVVYVTDRNGQRLYLTFDRSGVGKLATVFGLLPLAMFGGSLYAPLASVIIGGLISSTLLSRIVTPVMYLLIARGGEKDEDAKSASVAPVAG